MKLNLLLPVLFTVFPAVALSQPVNLALNRPVTVSSTDHAPTQAEFAVDGEEMTGWRARYFVDYSGDNQPRKTLPQWITVDLQGVCAVEKIKLYTEADASTGVFVKDRRFTIGHEIYSSYPTSFRIEGSKTGTSWHLLASVDDFTGGWGEFDLPGTEWRYIRLFIEDSSNDLPVAVNEIEIYGTCDGQRPATAGWKERRKGKEMPANTLVKRNDHVIPVEGSWEMTCNGWYGAENGAVVSMPGYDSSDWYNATVPGTVVTTLVDQEVFPDPVVGLNNLRIPEFLCRTSWWYRRSFVLPEGFEPGSGSRIVLEFDKINHHADIWVNGHKAGDIDYCFVQRSFDITDLLDFGSVNVIAVHIHPMELVGVPGDKGGEGNAWVNSRVISRSSPTYICSSGWDWMPSMRDRGMGILEEVRLRRVGTVAIDDFHVQTDINLPDTTRAFVSVNVTLKNNSAKDTATDLRVSFGATEVTKTVELHAGQTRDVILSPDDFEGLTVRDPLLWWPNGYGGQNLYDIEVTVMDNGRVSDRKESKFGIRKITYNTPLTRQRRGTHHIERTDARYVRVFMEETQKDRFGMFDLSVYDTRDNDNDLAAWKTAEVSSVYAPKYPASNLTDVRGVSKWFSAGNRNEWAIVDLGETKSFDMVITGWDSDGLASKYRIEVSDDKTNWRTVKEAAGIQDEHLIITVNGVDIFCKGGNWGLYELALRMPRERMENAIRFHKDSKMNMIRSWMGNFFDRDFFECCDKYGILIFSDLWGGMPEDKARYTEIAAENIKRFRNHPSIALWCASNETYPAIAIDEGIRDAVMALDSTRLYLSHSADDILWGGEGPYLWVPTEEYYDMAHGFKSEIGLPTVPVYETMLKLAGADQAWPISETWYYHDYSSKSEQAIGRYVGAFERMLGQVTSMEDYCRKAQFVNYDNIRAIFEAWNSKLWDDCSGVLLWMTHPAWYSTVWQTYDYDFEVNGTWAGAKKGCESIHIQMSARDSYVDVINNTSKAIAGYTATAKVYDIYGKQYGATQSQVASTAASSGQRLFMVESAQTVPALHFVHLQLHDGSGGLVSDNFYWNFDQPEDMQIINTAGEAELETKIIRRYEHEGRRYTELEIANTGSVIASMIRLSLRDENGERILPTLYSDNYFWLVPGNKRLVTLECATDDAPAQISVEISAYNAPVTSITDI